MTMKESGGGGIGRSIFEIELEKMKLVVTKTYKTLLVNS